MTRDQLGYVRLLSPGLCFVLLVWTLLAPAGFTLASLSKVWPILLLFAAGFGVVYLALDLRGELVKSIMRPVDDNIVGRLLASLRPGDLSEEAMTRLRQGRSVMNVFYQQIDNDKSIQIRRNRVFDNGAYISTTADVAIFSIAGFVAQMTFALVDNPVRHICLAIVSLGLGWFCRQVLLAKLGARHLQLSNEQLDFIAAHKSGQVREAIQRAAGH